MCGSCQTCPRALPNDIAYTHLFHLIESWVDVWGTRPLNITVKWKTIVVYCPILYSIDVLKYWQNQFEYEGVYLVYSSITRVKSGMELKARLKQWPWKNIAYCLTFQNFLHFFPYSIHNNLSRVSPPIVG